ncbi:hypothetical protein DPMN_159675 [Dreissena polymorpha]|uniref:Uncharacterized protein n=1 Tax=Dreissena polymorpha TaxID=45954 RepID=A0A9D4ELF4_DREPO|nr:hypothetical protein DPMN_159675 [Dreissena polymorpha]
MRIDTQTKKWLNKYFLAEQYIRMSKKIEQRGKNFIMENSSRWKRKEEENL